jgi:hypothetical protein
MALELQPADMQVLQERIRAAFIGDDDPQQTLRGFVTRTLAFNIFDEAGPKTGLTIFADLIIEKTLQDGTTDKLVRALFQERKGDTALREFVKRLLPEALPLVSQQEYEAALVAAAQEGVSGLERLRKDPAVAMQLGAVWVDLNRTSTDLAVLAAYKGLHDALHTLQLGLYGQILQELKRLLVEKRSAIPMGSGVPEPDQDPSAETLGLHAQELAPVVARAEDVADTLPDAYLVQPEKNWISSLDQVRRQLTSVSTKFDATIANQAAFSLGTLMRNQSGRLNLLLVQTARRIPWSTLIDTLRIVAKGLQDSDPERQPLVDAGNALEALMTDVLAQVEEHELWQAVESNFWQAEDALQQNNKAGAAQLSALWPMLTEQVRAIGEKVPGDWTRDLDRYATEFTTAWINPKKARVNARARSALQLFVRSGRVRFFNVDRELKARCQGIKQLSEPLRKLIRP